ncbi:MAG: hypothetical protein HRT86_14345 [Ilumatobacteraceae bacterium]|nr:hypothetical protein [Ilumatobacteraceae bacterium]
MAVVSSLIHRSHVAVSDGPLHAATGVGDPVDHLDEVAVAVGAHALSDQRRGTASHCAEPWDQRQDADDQGRDVATTPSARQPRRVSASEEMQRASSVSDHYGHWPFGARPKDGRTRWTMQLFQTWPTSAAA